MPNHPKKDEMKMVTKEDVDNAFRVGPGCSYDEEGVKRNLRHFAYRLLAERDAYREVAIDSAKDLAILPLERSELEKIVDAEALQRSDSGA